MSNPEVHAIINPIHQQDIQGATDVSSDVQDKVTASNNSNGGVSKTARKMRTTSCPPGVDRSITSGHWSIDWLSKHNHSEVVGQSNVSAKNQNKKKAGALLRHNVSRKWRGYQVSRSHVMLYLPMR